MITRNDDNTGLFNGDIGLCLPSPEHDHQLRVFFKQGQSIKAFLPARLTNHETAFAITIHKSQGSEFAHVMIVLPDEQNNPIDDLAVTGLLTKELLYTAITRAKQKVTLISSEQTLRQTIQRKVERTSGLAGRLSSQGEIKVENQSGTET
jgi:exodeoxyribonuclease V alpha subunit